MYKISYTGDRTTTQFLFGAECKWFLTSDIKVFINNVIVPESEYSVEPSESDPNYTSPEQLEANTLGIKVFFGGKVTFGVAPKRNVKIDIKRQISLNRIISFIQTNPIMPWQMNTYFDYLSECIKDIKDQIDYSLDADELREISENAQNKLEQVQAFAEQISGIDFSQYATVTNLASEITRATTAESTKANLTDLPQSNWNNFATTALTAGIDLIVARSAAGANPWYRKYKSGWVEQGGASLTTATIAGPISLPITMSDADYFLVISTNRQQTDYLFNNNCIQTTTALTQLKCSYQSKGNTVTISGWIGPITWEARGMAA